MCFHDRRIIVNPIKQDALNINIDIVMYILAIISV